MDAAMLAADAETVGHSCLMFIDERPRDSRQEVVVHDTEFD
jgi:hypothetical protein